MAESGETMKIFVEFAYDLPFLLNNLFAKT